MFCDLHFKKYHVVNLFLIIFQGILASWVHYETASTFMASIVLFFSFILYDLHTIKYHFQYDYSNLLVFNVRNKITLLYVLYIKKNFLMYVCYLFFSVLYQVEFLSSFNWKYLINNIITLFLYSLCSTIFIPLAKRKEIYFICLKNMVSLVFVVMILVNMHIVIGSHFNEVYFMFYQLVFMLLVVFIGSYLFKRVTIKKPFIDKIMIDKHMKNKFL